MSINPPSKLRDAIYLVSVFVNAVLASLLATGVSISVYIVAGIAGLNAINFVMAKKNVTPDEK